MKEFRHIMMIFALVALAAGCSKVEVVNAPEREISFTVGSYAPATKAVAVTEFTSFSSKGYLHAEGIDGTQDFFGAAGETITFNGTDTWAPSHPYYWPKGESSYINFVSWYDKKGAPSSVSETTISWTNRTITQDDNILVADKAWYQKENVQNYYTPGVPTLFKHLLAQVGVQAKATLDEETEGNVETTWTVKISNVTIHDVHTSGSLSLSNTTAPAEAETLKTTEWTGSWEVGSTTGNISGAATATTLDATDYTEILSWHAVLPQSIDDIYMSFDYEITTASENTTTHNTHTVTETINVPNLALSSFSGSVAEWQTNKKITYRININPKTNIISVVPSVDAWETASQSIIVE